MAGRKPRKTHDDQAGTNPLHAVPDTCFGIPRVKPPAGPKSGERVHGMRSERSIRARGEAYVNALLQDPHCPGHVRSTAFAADVMAWGRSEALVALMLEYAEQILAGEGVAGLFGLRPGVMRAPAEILSGLEERAARARTRLGISPAGYVRIARDANLGQNSMQAQLRQLEAEGGEIMEASGGPLAINGGEDGPA